MKLIHTVKKVDGKKVIIFHTAEMKVAGLIRNNELTLHAIETERQYLTQGFGAPGYRKLINACRRKHGIVRDVPKVFTELNVSDIH